MQVESARQAAPSRKSLAEAGYSTVMRKGQRPTARVLIATLLDGSEMVHRHVFLAHEGEKACEIQRALRAGATINLKHWRKVERREY